jgi:cytochrome c-type biogenesis protein CcmF
MAVLPAAAFGVATWLILGSFAEVFERTLLFRAPVANSVRRARGLPVAVLGAAIAHAGMGVTVAGIAGMSLASNKIVEAKPGDHFKVGGYDWQLESVVDAPGPNYTSRVAAIVVTYDGKLISVMRPSRRNFKAQNQTTSDVAIRTNLFRDLYCVLGEERDVNPLAPWIWLGALVMASGGALSLADRRLRVGAPSRIRNAVPA